MRPADEPPGVRSKRLRDVTYRQMAKPKLYDGEEVVQTIDGKTLIVPGLFRELGWRTERVRIEDADRRASALAAVGALIDTRDFLEAVALGRQYETVEFRYFIQPTAEEVEAAIDAQYFQWAREAGQWRRDHIDGLLEVLGKPRHWRDRLIFREQVRHATKAIDWALQLCQMRPAFERWARHA
jgi:hypothetical protein